MSGRPGLGVGLFEYSTVIARSTHDCYDLLVNGQLHKSVSKSLSLVAWSRVALPEGLSGGVEKSAKRGQPQDVAQLFVSLNHSPAVLGGEQSADCQDK